MQEHGNSHPRTNAERSRDVPLDSSHRRTINLARGAVRVACIPTHGIYLSRKCLGDGPNVEAHGSVCKYTLRAGRWW